MMKSKKKSLNQRSEFTKNSKFLCRNNICNILMARADANCECISKGKCKWKYLPEQLPAIFCTDPLTYQEESGMLHLRTITGNLLYRPHHLPRGVRNASSSNNYRHCSVQTPSLTKRCPKCFIFEQLPEVF